jgi:two-component system response regulator AtoC
MRLFMDYDWPGNVRELENVIKRTVVLGGETHIRKEISHGIAMATQRVPAPAPSVHVPAAGMPVVSRVGGNGVPPAPTPAPPTPAELAAAAAEAGNYSLKDISREAARQAERELILKMLQQTRWNRKETAEILGISYKALLYKIKENGLDKAS